MEKEKLQLRLLEIVDMVDQQKAQSKPGLIPDPDVIENLIVLTWLMRIVDTGLEGVINNFYDKVKGDI
jgi:hypothetical protein